MNDLMQRACLVGLAALPLCVLALRAARPKLMPWWAVFMIVIGLGWGLVLVSAMWNETTAGGAGHVFALFFGWAIVLVWFAPCFSCMRSSSSCAAERCPRTGHAMQRNRDEAKDEALPVVVHVERHGRDQLFPRRRRVQDVRQEKPPQGVSFADPSSNCHVFGIPAPDEPPDITAEVSAGASGFL